MKQRISLTGKHPAAEQHDAPRTAAVISAELDAARTTEAAIADKITQAQHAVESASSQYDAQLRTYATGGAPVPSRQPVADAIATLEGLRKVAHEQRATVAKLQAELTAAQRAENAANEEATTDALIAEAELKLNNFIRLASEAKLAERALFDALFKSGLKGGDYASEMGSRARDARLALTRKAIAAAKEIGQKIDIRFETDGNANLGDPEGAWEAHRARMAQEATRISECAGAPREMGKLIPEEIER